MKLPVIYQSASVQAFAATMQSKCAVVLDFTVGAVNRAIAEANAAVALWIQYLIVLLLSTTRAATSQGADLDTWMADWSFPREPAVAATGSVTVSRRTPTLPALIVPYINADGSVNAAGAQFKTIDGTQTFYATTDTTNPLWSATAGAAPGYYLPAGVSAGSVPVMAATPGRVGNIGPNTLTLSASATPGIDTVTNLVAFVDGLDAEADAVFRARFALYIQGLRSGISAAIIGAAEGVQQGVKLSLRNNYPGPGFYTLYADDGSGAASDSFIAAITAAVQPVTSEGVQPFVTRPTDVPVTVVVALQIAPGADRETVAEAVDLAIAAFIEGLPIGGVLPFLQLSAVVFNADPGVTGISTLTVNGATADVPAGVGGLITAATISIS